MQACGGAAVMGSLQQPTWTKGTIFPNKGLIGTGFSHKLKLTCVKPVRSSSYIEGSLVAGRPSSSVSVTLPEIGGNYTPTLEPISITFIYLWFHLYFILKMYLKIFFCDFLG